MIENIENTKYHGKFHDNYVVHIIYQNLIHTECHVF